MIDIKVFGSKLKELGYDFFSGVPCSFLKDLINYSMNNFFYIIAANEGDAVAIASGAYIGGKKSAVLMQNSGLTNAISPLTSLNYVFKIPVLGFVSLRGETGLNDEPQHELMGEITDSILNICRVKNQFLSQDVDEAIVQLKKADDYITKNSMPYFFIVRDKTFSEEKLNIKLDYVSYKKEIFDTQIESLIYTRLEVLNAISSFKNDNMVLLVNTGKAGRELFEIEDTKNNFYMVGSMGCVSSIGLGLAIAKPNKKIMAIDGDGALLMRMGSLATNGFYRPDNLLHILLDNNCHDSTGGQNTVSSNVDFTQVASSSGYTRSFTINDLEDLKKQINRWINEPALTFLNVKILKGSKKNLGRPTIKPYQVKERLMSFLNQG